MRHGIVLSIPRRRLDGYIVAEKDDTLLICRLSEEQRIKEFSAE